MQCAITIMNYYKDTMLCGSTSEMNITGTLPPLLFIAKT